MSSDFRDKCPNCGRLTMPPWKSVPTKPTEWVSKENARYCFVCTHVEEKVKPTSSTVELDSPIQPVTTKPTTVT